MKYVQHVAKGCVYHFTINFMADHTIHHTDEFDADGPGTWIFNLSLQGAHTHTHW